jgi:hypothetical protein
MASALNNVVMIGVSKEIKRVTNSTSPSPLASCHCNVRKQCEGHQDIRWPSLLPILTGQDALVICTPQTDLAVIDAAIKAGIKRIVPGEFGSNSRNKSARRCVPRRLANPNASTISSPSSRQVSRGPPPTMAYSLTCRFQITEFSLHCYCAVHHYVPLVLLQWDFSALTWPTTKRPSGIRVT